MSVHTVYARQVYQQCKSGLQAAYITCHMLNCKLVLGQTPMYGILGFDLLQLVQTA